MTGHHEVQVFRYQESDLPASMPAGWKPFAADYEDGVLWVVARRWHRQQRELYADAELVDTPAGVNRHGFAYHPEYGGADQVLLTRAAGKERREGPGER
jgi:hypothetical protein